MLSLTATKPAIKVVYDQVGTPTYAGDLAKAIYTILEDGLHVGNEGIYNFSNEGVCSWYDFTKAIHRIAGIESCKVSPIHTTDYPTPARRPPFSVLDKSKIKKTYSIEIPYWETSLNDCIERIRNNKE